ncbi:RNA ligase RtcB family protein [Roseibium sp. MMSF_3412]|uniref:RNA ligase RtcB family protein n=1 Tax=Roseibium sp. MMSF_3412 TaxID=3046712 RepID=UPI00273D1F04|nr:RNA ligase RtcB family protein [Roseibium sp. MMSF_3412]
MGTSQTEGPSPSIDAAPVHRFYSSKTWIEGAAEEQLDHVSEMAGVSQVAAFPDLHPGKYGPVGSAILADRIYPQLIGNDIGCGMCLFALDLPARKLRIDKAAQKFRMLEGPWSGDASERLAAQGLAHDLHPKALGTIGGGNHFCELQMVDEANESFLPADLDLKKGDLVLLVHSGSRSLGTAVFGSALNGFSGLDPEGPAGKAYLSAHGDAVRWASLNRLLIAERAAGALRADLRLICDAPHNLIEGYRGLLLHRKGAAKADGPLVPLAGSRDAFSYLLAPRMDKLEALASLAHGSGRKYDRRSMTGRAGATRSEREGLVRTSFGGQVICEDRQLLVEEAPGAYKDPGQVLEDLRSNRLADCAATLKPLLTFKKAISEDLLTARREKRNRMTRRRGER